MRNRFLGFVAHVGEPECLAFDFAVAAVDDEMMFGAQIADEFRDVDAAAVFHAGQRLRAKTFLGEEIEATFAHPIVNEGIGFGVALVTIRQPLSENIVELRLEGVDMPNARGGRSHIAFLVLLEFEEVEVIAAVSLCLRACETFFRDGKEGETRRQRECFLAAGEEEVDPEFIHGNWDGRERRNRIDDQRDVRIFSRDGADFIERVHDSGRGLAVNQRDGIEVARGEFLIERGRVDRFAPFHLERLGGFPAAAADVEPFIREGATHAIEHAARHEISNRRFHYAPGR